MNPLAVYEDHVHERESSRPGYSTSGEPGQANVRIGRTFQERPAALATVAIESVPP
jgi:hypothetical protein